MRDIEKTFSVWSCIFIYYILKKSCFFYACSLWYWCVYLITYTIFEYNFEVFVAKFLLIRVLLIHFWISRTVVIIMSFKNQIFTWRILKKLVWCYGWNNQRIIILWKWRYWFVPFNYAIKQKIIVDFYFLSLWIL